MVWTRFMDMHSGGGRKESFDMIYIEAPEEQAKSVFFARFGHNPDRVSCTCCGSDYSIDESLTLEEASAYERNCDSAWFYTDTGEEIVNPDPINDPYWSPPASTWDRDLKTRVLNGRPIESRYVERQGKGRLFQSDKGYKTVAEYEQSGTALFIRAEDIGEDEKATYVPQQGYVWND